MQNGKPCIRTPRLPTDYYLLLIIIGKADRHNDKKISNEELVARIRAGQNIKGNMEQLYNQNLPLIRQFIKPFLRYEDEADLLQQAYLGLHKSTEMYESSENVKFMTYSKFWIQQEVRRYLENSGSLIRIPSAGDSI